MIGGDALGVLQPGPFCDLARPLEGEKDTKLLCEVAGGGGPVLDFERGWIVKVTTLLSLPILYPYMLIH